MSESAKRALDKPGIYVAVMRGEPLADFDIIFADGLDYVALTEQMNRLADDLFVHRTEHYASCMRVGVATRAALKREFGYVLKRGPLPHPNTGYWWEETTNPCRLPRDLERCILKISVTQPGGGDLGQPWPFDDP
jgi:hypothetical protein